MKKVIRLTESDLHRIVRNSVKKVLKEVKLGGESLHGNNPVDWRVMDRIRNSIGHYYWEKEDNEGKSRHGRNSVTNFYNAEKLDGGSISDSTMKSADKKQERIKSKLATQSLIKHILTQDYNSFDLYNCDDNSYPGAYGLTTDIDFNDGLRFHVDFYCDENAKIIEIGGIAYDEYGCPEIDLDHINDSKTLQVANEKFGNDVYNSLARWFDWED